MPCLSGSFSGGWSMSHCERRHDARRRARRGGRRRHSADERQLARRIRDRAEHGVRAARRSKIVGTSVGVDETQLLELGWLREYGDVTPVIEGEIALRRGRSSAGDAARPWHRHPARPVVPRLPADRARGAPERPVAFATARAVVRSFSRRSSRRRAALAIGSTFAAIAGDRTVTLTVRGLLKDEGPARVLDGHFVLMDIAAAQLLLDRLGRIDRVEIRLHDPSADRARRAGDSATSASGAWPSNARHSAAGRSSRCSRRSISI